MCPGNSDILVLKYPEPYGAYVQVVSQCLSVGETVVAVAIVVVVLVDELAVTRKETNHIEWNGTHTSLSLILYCATVIRAHPQQIT